MPTVPLRVGLQFDTAFLWHEPPGIPRQRPGVFRLRRWKGERSTSRHLCRLLGLPADPVFEGKFIPGFTGRPAVPAAAWAKVAPVERLVPATNSADEKKTADEFTKKLISLGYLTGAEASAVDARPANRAGTETAGSFQNVGTFLRFRNQPAEAVGWYRKALEVNPKFATGWMNLSTALHMVGKFDESDDALVTSLVNGYSDRSGRCTAACSTEAEGRNERPQLVSFLKKVVAAFPKEDATASLGRRSSRPATARTRGPFRGALRPRGTGTGEPEPPRAHELVPRRSRARKRPSSAPSRSPEPAGREGGPRDGQQGRPMR